MLALSATPGIRNVAGSAPISLDESGAIGSSRQKTVTDKYYPSTRAHVPALLAPDEHYPRCCAALSIRRGGVLTE